MAAEEPSKPVVNFTCYKFVNLPDRDELRQPFRDVCKKLELKGLVMLSHEGINFFLAGSEEGKDGFMEFLGKDERFSGIVPKISYSETSPFKRMLVKLKKEIIALGIDSIDPPTRTGNYLPPKEFKEWLDEGKDVVVLDTRNDYEMRVGTFKNAINLKIDSFRDFPDAIKQLPEEMKEKPMVTFCTGGVRCEKATVVMMDAGFKDVYQIDGGILKYFEDCGGAHWDGDCFVFDNRVALRPDLTESDYVMCFKCREPLTPEEVKSPDYIYEKQCPYCVGKQHGKKRHAEEGSSDEDQAAPTEPKLKQARKEE